jgi:hypothetical protein
MSFSKLGRLSRRQFFTSSANTVAGGAALTGLFDGLVARSAAAARGRVATSPGYGSLRARQEKN